MKWSLSNKLERKVTDYLQELDLLNIAFFQGTVEYIEGKKEEFKRRKEDVQKRESHLDDLRRFIEWELYRKMLIPESRADILKLLEGLDEIADLQERLIMQFFAEKPHFPDSLLKTWDDLQVSCKKAVEELVLTAGAFFRGDRDLEQRIQRVSYYEKESDQLEEAAKVLLFSLEDLGLAEKIQLRQFIEKLSRLADFAEDIADMIGIFRIKREI